jgi:glycerol kinase
MSVGITNQRETFVCWNKLTGKTYHNAIVWSDARTKEICQRITQKYGGDKNHFKHKTGLPIATYFSAFKAKWLMENVPEISKDLNNVMFGTMDTFVNYV